MVQVIEKGWVRLLLPWLPLVFMTFTALGCMAPKPPPRHKMKIHLTDKSVRDPRLIFFLDSSDGSADAQTTLVESGKSRYVKFATSNATGNLYFRAKSKEKVADVIVKGPGNIFLLRHHPFAKADGGITITDVRDKDNPRRPPSTKPTSENVR